jgi:endonuclease/exonuclease/phosphatase family metal-dependent hydrolase
VRIVSITLAAIASTAMVAGAQSLPSGWSAQDIGSVGASGYTESSGGSIVARGAGADIWGSADGFHFAYRSLTGDGEIVTRVDYVDYLHAWSKAGVMMRESLSPGSRHAYMLISAGKGAAFQRRTSTSGSSVHTDGGSGWGGYYVKLARSGNNFEAYKSTDGYNWTWVGTEWISMPSTIYVGVAVTSHYWGALAAATLSGTAVHESASAAPASGSLPSGWASRDIGNVAAGGWADSGGSAFTMGGSGADIWGAADEFHFAYRSLNGDGTIVARVTHLDWMDSWSKAGVMMRESLSAGAPHAYMLVSAGKGLAFQRRPWGGGESYNTSAGGGAAPVWVKLSRSGSTFSAFASWDGSNWAHVGSQSISMGGTIYVGLAVTSHNDGAVASASFSDVAVSNTVQASPVSAPVQSGNSTSSLRVLHWNVHHLIGTDGVFDPGRVAWWIAQMQPDIISLNEIDDSWMAGVITDAIASATGRNWNTKFSGWGNLVLTRGPLNGSSVCTFNPGAGRKAAHVSTSWNGRTINIWSAHLATDGSGTRSYEIYNLQDCAAGWGEARIIAGDFNMQASSSEYSIAASGYVDGWLAARSTGTTANYSGNCDGCTRNSRIDYIFSSQSAWFLSVESARIYDTRDGSGHMPSDHKPLVVSYRVQ